MIIFQFLGMAVCTIIIVGTIGIAIDTILNASRDSEKLLRENHELRYELYKLQNRGKSK